MRPLTITTFAILFFILIFAFSADARRYRKHNRDKSVDNLEGGSDIVENTEEGSTTETKKSRAKDSHSNSDHDSTASADEEDIEPQENNQPLSSPFNEDQSNGNKSRPRGLVGTGIQLFRRKTRKPLPTPNISALLKPTLPSFLTRSKSKASAQADAPEEEKENTSQSSDDIETKSGDSQFTTSHRQRPEAPERRRKRPRNKGRFSRRRRPEATINN
ncbi:uncharacterized protein LOC143240364 isoform X3 [Tachypleus tridentatus]|uniref:uncharacterized protein LOC143240364 isoform X2 n=1 Tax=Tachypleus tridentatus TaxID=6853 RepID=UPI003FD11B5D